MKYLILVLLFVTLIFLSFLQKEKKILCDSKEISYEVVSSFGAVVGETKDKEEAFQLAKDLTYFGRVLSSKPIYFVLEKK